VINIIDKGVRFLFGKLISQIKFYTFAFKFRRLNAYNQTFPANMFDINNVTIGKHTYGKLHVKSYCKDAGEKLIIGNYVSIADDVKFILGGNHQISTITTYPLKANFTNRDFHIDASSKGAIVVEDEVWLGYGTIILSGIRIGKGAIIAAGSVVTKDVPPYSIVGGNPANVIKYRFNEVIREALLDFNLSDIEETRIIENIEAFYSPLDVALIERLKKIRINDPQND
jgi:acetyltransferase-like isoleucine patch superfamily enzyme